MPVVGAHQSPIRIETAKALKVPSNFDKLTFHYSGTHSGTFKEDNFVFGFPKPPSPEGFSEIAGKTIRFGKDDWVIRKIHIHIPAEHRFDEDEPYPIECHLLHSMPGDVKARGAKIVLAAFFEVIITGQKTTKKQKAAMAKMDRATIPALNQAAKDFLALVDRAVVGDEPVAELDPFDFLPHDDLKDRWYHYQGSLTSEPFSEDVSWFVMPDVTPIEHAKIDGLIKAARQTPRGTHALDRRYVIRSF